MSFILDQMIKAGKQRALEMAMRRQTGQTGEIKAGPQVARSVNPTPVSAKTWRIAAVAVLLGMVVLYGVISFSGVHTVQQPVVPGAKGPVQEASPLHSMPSSDSVVQTPPAPVTGTATVSAPTKSPEAKPIKTEAAKIVKPVTAEDKVREASEQADLARSTEGREKQLPAEKIDAPGRSGVSGSVSSDSVLEFKQLPQAVRKSLPEIRITSHLYRKDSRLVSINGRIMSEGFNMDDGLFLEEITSEGVILSYGKHRFLVRAGR